MINNGFSNIRRFEASGPAACSASPLPWVTNQDDAYGLCHLQALQLAFEAPRACAPSSTRLRSKTTASRNGSCAKAWLQYHVETLCGLCRQQSIHTMCFTFCGSFARPLMAGIDRTAAQGDICGRGGGSEGGGPARAGGRLHCAAVGPAAHPGHPPCRVRD